MEIQLKAEAQEIKKRQGPTLDVHFWKLIDHLQCCPLREHSLCGLSRTEGKDRVDPELVLT